jgi:putative ATP-dependent endonuclease of OLD family
VARARAHLDKSGGRGAVVVLPAADIEHYLYKNGYADVIRKAARASGTRSAKRVIKAAVERVSKPGLALLILAEADTRGPGGVPPVLRELALVARQMARGQLGELEHARRMSPRT